MNIRDYLIREAQRITDHALTDYTDAEAWRKLLPDRRRQFFDMMGLETLPPIEQRTPPVVQVTGVVERPNYRIEKLVYESLPWLFVTANLYIPKDVPSRGSTEKLPGVLYVCGHASTQKIHYQAHPRRFAELGFVCLAVDTVQYSEIPGYHHGCYREGWWHWYSKGYTPGGVELLNGIRGLDLLAQRPEVDASRLGVTGISGGGAVSWYVAAGDERIKVAAPICGTATLASHIADRTIDGHCDCMWWTNTSLWDLADIGALIAPRPLLIGSADRDDIFTIGSIRKVHHQLERLYGILDAKNNLHLVETPGGHSYHARSRTGIFSLFMKHLQGKEVPPEQVGDIDESPKAQEEESTLRVFVDGYTGESRNCVIQETFVPRAVLPKISDRADVERKRLEVIHALREKTFHAFPASTPPLNVEFKQESHFDNGTLCCRFSYTTEEDWRLHGEFQKPNKASSPAPTMVALRSPEETRQETERFISGTPSHWARAIVEPRGTGDTAWGQELQWHIRRASAWTGRTIASMRVWDTLRALEAIRTLEDVKREHIALVARGEMAAVALYAALLDGKVRTLLLQSPPATQNAPSRPDGRGEAIEMLNCLRITDLPQIAGLLYPVEIVLIGDCPDTYRWAEEVYQKLGAPGKIKRVKELSEWKPN